VSGTSLRQATLPQLRRLLTFQNLRLDHIVPTSHTTAATWLNAVYKKHQSTVIAALTKSTSGVTVSFDGWKANNNILDLLGVIAHYLDEHYQLRTVVLGLRDTLSSYIGEIIGDYLFDVLGDYTLRSKVTYFAADNASNNDTALSYLATKIKHYQP
jgi:hypothetical protein